MKIGRGLNLNLKQFSISDHAGQSEETNSQNKFSLAGAGCMGKIVKRTV